MQFPLTHRYINLMSGIHGNCISTISIYQSINDMYLISKTTHF